MGLTDPWVALQFDQAVVMVGSVLDAAAQETYNAGSKTDPQWQPRYSLSQLLDPNFRLPAVGTLPGVQTVPGNGIAALAQLPGVRVVKG